MDDGSLDRTAAVAEAHAAEDGRIRLIRQENGGVARARNSGAATSRADYIAPVDADDLWHPEKIARQLAALRAAGSEAGYAYTYFRRIDLEGRLLRSSGHCVEGAAFLRLILFNFVGNGSSLLIRRAAFEAVGGYDPVLRHAGLQGCEDHLLQILIARHWHVACVPEYLTGYRQSPGAMSADTMHMLRSYCMVLEMVRTRHPETPDWILASSEAWARAIMSVRHLRRGRFGAARAEAARAIRRHLRTAIEIGVKTILNDSRNGLARRLAALSPRPAQWRPHFNELTAMQVFGVPMSPPLAHHIATAAELEDSLFVPTQTDGSRLVSTRRANAGHT